MTVKKLLTIDSKKLLVNSNKIRENKSRTTGKQQQNMTEHKRRDHWYTALKPERKQKQNYR